MAFGIGITKGGVIGGLIAGLTFLFPGLIMMTLFGLAATTV